MGGWTLEDAEAICGGNEEDVLDGITALHLHSLIVRTDQPDEPLRYGMLETVREFAVERLDASDEAGVIRERHARHFAAKVREARIGYFAPTDPPPWRTHFPFEVPNLRVALAWEVAQGRADLLFHLIEVAWWTWLPDDATEWIDLAISGTFTIPDGQYPLLLAAAAEYAMLRREVPRAVALVEACGDVAREDFDLKALAIMAQVRGMIALTHGDHHEAERHSTEALARWQALDEPSWRILEGHWRLGGAILGQGDPARAVARFETALAMARATDAPWTVPRLLDIIATCALRMGNPRRCAELTIESLTLMRDGWVAFPPIQVNSFFLDTAASCLDRLGAMAAAMGEDEWGVRLFAAAGMLRERQGIPATPLEESRIERDLGVIRQRLPDADFSAAWSAGRALSP